MSDRSNSWPSRFSVPVAILVFAARLAAAKQPETEAGALPGLTYTNTRIADGPLSIHVVQLDRRNPLYQIESVHARDRAIGLDTLTDQLGLVNSATGSAVAAINGDYYQRENAYAGAPRGLQVMNGELLSAPSDEACFWIDAIGEPHAGTVSSQFQITWADGTSTALGLNGERQPGAAELYTQAIGISTQTKGGRELVLTPLQNGPWQPLHLGRIYPARVQEIRETGGTPLASNIMVLSLDPELLRRRLPRVQAGDVVHISMASQPLLRGIRTAISGGPMLIHDGKRQRFEASDSLSYKDSTMTEEHPRAAIGWNDDYLYFVEVDGRQKRLSIGMTLEDLAKFFENLGCAEAMNFDGGGSATLWFNGQVRNSPCDRMEREIANCLVIVKKKR